MEQGSNEMQRSPSGEGLSWALQELENQGQILELPRHGRSRQGGGPCRPSEANLGTWHRVEIERHHEEEMGIG